MSSLKHRLASRVNAVRAWEPLILTCTPPEPHPPEKEELPNKANFRAKYNKVNHLHQDRRTRPTWGPIPVPDITLRHSPFSVELSPPRPPKPLIAADLLQFAAALCYHPERLAILALE